MRGLALTSLYARMRGGPTGSVSLASARSWSRERRGACGLLFGRAGFGTSRSRQGQIPRRYMYCHVVCPMIIMRPLLQNIMDHNSTKAGFAQNCNFVRLKTKNVIGLRPHPRASSRVLYLLQSGGSRAPAPERRARPIQAGQASTAPSRPARPREGRIATLSMH